MPFAEERGMNARASFQQILEEKIHSRQRETLAGRGSQEPSQSQDPAHLAYLLGLRGATFTRPSAAKIYPSRPKPPPPPHNLTESQAAARGFFVLQGVELSPAFTEGELKKAFRLLALKLHPDMNKGASGAFIELKKNYETLRELFRSGI